MMLARLLCALILGFSLPAHAADTAAPTIVHLLDYVGVDYPAFVKDGKVIDAAEYQEQQEFAAQVIELLQGLPPVARRDALIAAAVALKEQIDAKAPGTAVAAQASALRWQVIEAYGLTIAPAAAPDLKMAATRYAETCAACHGAEGRGDGPAAAALDPRPSDFHDEARMEQRSIYGLYSTITLGVGGTAMKAFKELSESERWALAWYVSTLGLNAGRIDKGGERWRAQGGKSEIGSLRAVATLTATEVAHQHGEDAVAVFAWLKAHPEALADNVEAPIARSRRLLGESAAAYRAGRRDEAQQLALTAYLEGFELAEAGLDTVAPDLRVEVETQMIAYRDLVRRGADPARVTGQAEHIDRLLAESAEKLGAGGLAPTTAALSAFFILVREGLEALLVVAAIIAFLLKAGRRDAMPWIHAGWIGALALGGVTWVVASTLIAVSGATRELTEGVTALLAAAILLYVGCWLHGKSHARAWKAFIDQYLGAALKGRTLWALAGVSFLAVYREAFETVLFYQALWQQAGPASHAAVLIGFAAGVAALAVIAWLILRYGVRIPVGIFFAASAVLLAILAVVFTGHGVKALQEAGVIAASPIAMGSLPALGVYPTLQTIAAQVCVILAVATGFAWARIANRRAVTTG